MEGFKTFVSENELEAKRKRRQTEWDKVRKPDDPEEAPEEEYDPRSLFERLQQQKAKVQAEFEESRRLKNLIAVLDEDETSFLALVDKTKMDKERQQAQEERQALQEFRQAIDGLTKDEQDRKIEEFKISFALKGASKKPKRTSSNPLSNLIKLRKSDESKDSPSDSVSVNKSAERQDQDDEQPDRECKTKNENKEENQKEQVNEDDKGETKNSKISSIPAEHKPESTNEPKTSLPLKPTPTCLVDYGSDSEESEDDDSDNNTHPNKKIKTTL